MPAQNKLFDDLPVDRYLGQSKDALTLVISIPKLGAQQKLFNDLLAKIEKTGQDLEALKQLELAHGVERNKKLQPAKQQTQDIHEKFVLLLDQRLQTPKGLSKKQLADLGYVAAVMADSLDAVADMSGTPLRPELQVVVDRLCAVLDGEDEVDDEVAQGMGAAAPRSAQNVEVELAEIKRMMSEMAGVELGDDFGADAQTPEELMELVMRKMQTERDAAQEAHQARHAKRKKTPKQQKAEQEAQQATMDADSALRMIYRKLASALHPDREPDEAKRIRKTHLMGQVNAANDAKDLLTLLRLQLQIEQIDPLAIATMADDKLKSYNRMLKEQLQTVQHELLIAQDRLRYEWQLGYGVITLKAVQSSLREQLQAMNAQNAYMQADLQQMQDDKYLKSWVKEQIRQLAAAETGIEHWL
jgi:hypothetical protein